MNASIAQNLIVPQSVSARAAELFKEQQQNIIRYTDWLCSWLMILQWFFAVGVAFWLSPRTWSGTSSHIHPHIWAAIFLGGIISGFPIYLARTQPGRTLTRHAVAAGQMLMSALLIHLTGGRIETHFHVFGSLAILAFYRDWRVLVTATIVIAVDHLARGFFWPESVFGVSYAPWWRAFEHAGWVIFEVTFLIIAIRKSISEMHVVAERQAKLEAMNETVERTVAERTAELNNERKLLSAIINNSPDNIYVKDTAGRRIMANPADVKVMGFQTEAEVVGKTDFDVFPHDLAAQYLADDQKVIQDGQIILSREEKVISANGTVRCLLSSKIPLREADGKIIGLVGMGRDITVMKEAESKLEQANKQLMDASRRAGMAEVATSVLHNVGNVLNSVNVSASLVAEKMQKSKITNVVKVAELLREHQNDLANFITTDARGKQLPDYLGKLAEHLTWEQSKILAEIGTLVNNIIHIKEIVTMQQGYAKASDIMEPLKAVDLVEDALRMNTAAVDRHQIKVIRDFSEMPAFFTDKHKVLQILVNLIRNSKHACDDSGRNDKEITLRVRNGEGRVKISVIDNGVGIAPENITRVFNHGFTTRKEGHGFGLHSGANAAKELGGTLTAFSEGVGRGAVFTLELPANQASKKS